MKRDKPTDHMAKERSLTYHHRKGKNMAISIPKALELAGIIGGVWAILVVLALRLMHLE